MKSKDGSSEKKEQVFSDKFLDYDYAWNLTQWLNRHSDRYTYWLEQVEG